ncbi:MAG: aldehyde ferredoxin oxidoreductase C-terminal domain-containing protein [Desulfobacterales bacterium]|nr:aldehyde ferredoxin oxidoreductase C-terminal domain-containing protein [Desulfobacterales bacterium]
MEAGLAKFGDAQAAINLVKEVGKGTPLGRILGSGAAVTGKVFGVERVPVVKGQAMPAYDPRGDPGHRRHLRHQHPWARTTRPAMRSPPTSWGSAATSIPLKPEGPDRAFAQPADRHRRDRLHRHVPLHRLRHPGPARHLPGAAGSARQPFTA